jgi:four helix bundle protein
MNSFEDLIAWQKARQLTKSIYEVTRRGYFAKDYGLIEQIRRAVVSIMSNIAEGFERNRRAEFHQFLSVAKASAAEVRSQLYVALDVGYLSQNEFATLSAKANEVARILGGLRQSVARQRDAQRSIERKVLRKKLSDPNATGYASMLIAQRSTLSSRR